MEKDLNNNVKDDNVRIAELEAQLERAKEMVKRKELLKKHKSPITQLPNGRWYTRIDGKKVERTNREELINLICNEYESEEITINDIFNSYLHNRKIEIAATTWQKDVRYYNTFIKASALGCKPIQSLCVDDAYSFFLHCKTVKPDMKLKYWKGIMITLNSLIKYCISRNLINYNPFQTFNVNKDLFTAPTQTQEQDSVFSDEEANAIIRLAEEEAEAKMSCIPLGIVLLFNLGIRDGELCALKWKDIETRDNHTYIHINREIVAKIDENGKARGTEIKDHCKTPAGNRLLILSEHARVTLEKIRRINLLNKLPVTADDYIFLRRVNNEITYCTVRCFDSMLRRFCRKANMKVIKSPHDIRRTVITNLYEANTPVKLIQAFAGHASISQTQSYIRNKRENKEIEQYINNVTQSFLNQVNTSEQEMFIKKKA